MRLSPAAFNRHLNHMGQWVDWSAATACPCVDVHSGAAKPGCPLCFGKGMIFSAPVRCVVGVASQKVLKNWAAMGQYEMGDAILVVGSDSAAYSAGRWDRIVMRNGSDRFSRTLVRGRNDKILDPVEKISRVFWLVDGSVVDGGIPTVGADGELSWASGEPPAGMQYSVTGTKFAEYHVYNSMPSDRNEHLGQLLPKNLVVRRADVMGR